MSVRSRSPEEVARRAFALALYKWRASYEEGWAQEPVVERKAMTEELADMAAFLDESGLTSSLSKIESALYRRKPGSWHPVDVKEGGWRGENLLALLWALGRRELPSVWVQSGGVHVFVATATERWREHVAHATLRPIEEIARMGDYLEAVRLRVQTPDDFCGIAWLADKAEGFGGGAPIDGDLPIDGKPFRDLDASTRSTVRSLALERHRALVWVLGEENDLDARAPEV